MPFRPIFAFRDDLRTGRLSRLTDGAAGNVPYAPRQYFDIGLAGWTAGGGEYW